MKYYRSMLILFSLLILSCGGGGGEEYTYKNWECVIQEATDYYDGTTFHRFYRGDVGGGSGIGYATSTDGIHFKKDPRNPVLKGGYCFPSLAIDTDTGNKYLIVKKGSGTPEGYFLYDANDPANLKILNDGQPISRFPGFNVSVAIVGGRWHMVVEGKSGDVFHMKYTYADFPNLNFDENFADFGFGDASCPYITYVASRNALMFFYGAGYNGGSGILRVDAYTALLSDDLTQQASWKHGAVPILLEPGVLMGDPDFGIGVATNPLIMSINHAQIDVWTYLFHGTMEELYDLVRSDQKAQFELYPEKPTMDQFTGW